MNTPPPAPLPLQNVKVVAFAPDSLPVNTAAARAVAQTLIGRLQIMGCKVAGAPLPVPAKIAPAVAPADILWVGGGTGAEAAAARAAGMRCVWIAAADAAFPDLPAGTIVIPDAARLPELLRDARTGGGKGPPLSRAARNLVAALRGLPEEGPWPAGRRHEDPERQIGELLREFVASLNAQAQPLEVIRNHWEHLVGDVRVAAGGEPHQITKQGALRIACQSPVICDEFRWRLNALLEAIQHLPTCGKIKKLSLHLV